MLGSAARIGDGGTPSCSGAFMPNTSRYANKSFQRVRTVQAADHARLLARLKRGPKGVTFLYASMRNADHG